MPLDEPTKQRIEILSALIVAIDNRVRLFDMIAAAPSANEARERLMKAFDFNEAQAVAVLDLQARRFAKLERGRLVEQRDGLLGR